MISNRMRLITAITLVSTAAGIVVDSPSVSADMTSFAWSSAGQIQSGTNSNVVGFWQTVGQFQGTSGCPGPSLFIDGKFGAKTVAQTKAMQNELATPVQQQTGVVSIATWTAVQNGIAPGVGARLNRVDGVPGGHGHYGYYNGGADSSANLYWQGYDTGTHGWKFLPPGAANYLVATTARTMGTYTVSCIPI